MKRRVNYCGMHVVDKQRIDTELASNVILLLHRGKAAEHLIYSHPSIAVVLSKLFQLNVVWSCPFWLSTQLYSSTTENKRLSNKVSSLR